MPEAGYLPIPAKLARAGVKDMVRISDARMSGTAYGTIVLHVSPEAAVGGPLALVRNGDRIRLSVKERQLDLLVDDARAGAARAPRCDAAVAPPARGYAQALHRPRAPGRARLRLRLPAKGVIRRRGLSPAARPSIAGARPARCCATSAPASAASRSPRRRAGAARPPPRWRWPPAPGAYRLHPSPSRPSGFSGDGVTTWCTSSGGTSVARGSA